MYLKSSLHKKAASIQRRAERNSNVKIDLLRVYAMFCVVFSHCFCYWPHALKMIPDTSVYSVMTFIFCAGYFYQEAQDRVSAGEFIPPKARAYVVPYFIWNLVYGVLCTLLRHSGMIYFGQDLGIKTFLFYPWTNGAQFLFNYAAWFLLSLFLVSVVTWLVRKGAAKLIKSAFLRNHLVLAGFMALSIVALVLLGQNQNHMEPMIGILRPMTLLPFYQLGFVYRTYWENRGRPVIWFAASLGLVVLLQIVNGAPFSAGVVYGNFAGNPVLFLLASMGMILMLCSLIDLVERFIPKCGIVKYCSRSTMYIMLHHLFVVFCINLVFWLSYKGGILSGFDAASFQDSFWYRYQPFGQKTIWLYVAVGFTVPVLVHWCYEKVVLRLHQTWNS